MSSGMATSFTKSINTPTVSNYSLPLILTRIFDNILPNFIFYTSFNPRPDCNFKVHFVFKINEEIFITRLSDQTPEDSVIILDPAYGIPGNFAVV